MNKWGSRKSVTDELQSRNYSGIGGNHIDPNKLIHILAAGNNLSNLPKRVTEEYLSKLGSIISRKLIDKSISLKALHNLAIFINSLKGDWVLTIRTNIRGLGYTYRSRTICSLYTTMDGRDATLCDIITSNDRHVSLSIERRHELSYAAIWQAMVMSRNR